MQVASRFLALLLATVLLVASFATGAFAADSIATSPHPTTPGTAHPLGSGNRCGACHAHGGMSPQSPHSQSQSPQGPSPTPVSYQCCLTGHNVAVVQASQSPQPSNRCIHFVSTIASAFAIRSAEIELSAILYVDPPGMAPLRI